MTKTQNFAAAAVAAATILTGTAQAEPIKNIVLVHGAFLRTGRAGAASMMNSPARGYAVAIVQNPLTLVRRRRGGNAPRPEPPERPRYSCRSFLRRQRHHGGGRRRQGGGPRVCRAFAPEIGQSTLDQYAEIAPPPNFVLEEQSDGFAYLNGDKFRAGFAADTSEADAAFLRDAQVPIAMAALKAKVTAAAWKTKPSWYVVATEDGAIAPELLRRTARRIGAATTEVKGSHVVFLTQPKAVADVIEQAAKSATVKAAAR